MNINPKIWGRDSWNFFYYVALSYPKNPSIDDKLKFKKFYTIAGSMVPCEKCKMNFGKHLQELPIDNYLDTPYNLFTWLTKMENKVRVLNNRPEKSVENNFQYYMNIIEDKNIVIFNLTNKEKILIGMGILILFLIIFKRFKF